MDWSKYSALKSDSKASIAEGVQKEAVKYVKDDDIPKGKKVGDVKEAEVKQIYLSQKDGMLILVMRWMMLRWYCLYQHWKLKKVAMMHR